MNTIADIKIYPNPGAESFVNIHTATEIAQGMFPDKATAWGSLSDQEKEALLVQTFLFIMGCPGLQIPDNYGQEIGQGTPMADFMIAQTFLALHFMDVDLFDTTPDNIIQETIGPMTTKYDTGLQQKSIPDFFYSIMGQYGCSNNKGFSQSNLKG